MTSQRKLLHKILLGVWDWRELNIDFYINSASFSFHFTYVLQICHIKYRQNDICGHDVTNLHKIQEACEYIAKSEKGRCNII